jgi:hypothetical protein
MLSILMLCPIGYFLVIVTMLKSLFLSIPGFSPSPIYYTPPQFYGKNISSLKKDLMVEFTSYLDEMIQGLTFCIIWWGSQII